MRQTTTRGARPRRAPATLALALLVCALAACVPARDAPPASLPPSIFDPSPDVSAPSPAPVEPPPVLLPAGAPDVLATGLTAPWSILRVPGGGVLVSERDSGRIVEVLPDGSLRVAAELGDVVPGGEGGLLGLAYLPRTGTGGPFVYAYFTAASDNRIVRMPLTGAPGELELGTPKEILTGIPRAGNHNGGRLAFGPDGYLYATVGDAGNRDAAQDTSSLSGKILRMTPAGDPAPGNPFDNRTWSYGHRNPQGLAWDAAGGMWAAEFGQNTWDELNRIEPGANYGWPLFEGVAGEPGFVDPVMQWSTSEASPSGLAIIGDTLFLAALRGERIWSVAPATAGGELTATEWFPGAFGRIRDVTAGPDGTLWFIGNNTDGRGSPREGDDRLFELRLDAVATESTG